MRRLIRLNVKSKQNTSMACIRNQRMVFKFLFSTFPANNTILPAFLIYNMVCGSAIRSLLDRQIWVWANSSCIKRNRYQCVDSSLPQRIHYQNKVPTVYILRYALDYTSDVRSFETSRNYFETAIVKLNVDMRRYLCICNKCMINTFCSTLVPMQILELT